MRSTMQPHLLTSAQASPPRLLVRVGLSDLLSEKGHGRSSDGVARAEYVSLAGAAYMVAGDRKDIFATSVNRLPRGASCR